jgi:transcriptional regulator
MYVPAAFAGSQADAHALIDAEPFATVIASGDSGMIASHLPLMREGDTLLGHLAGPNPQAELLAERARAGREVLAIFHGPHFYVSPTWYATKSGTVPTWNYAAVHVYGVPKVTSDPARLEMLVGKLAAIYETAEWRLADQPRDFVAKMIGGIVGFEIPIARIDAKFKLSQNRPAADREGVLAAISPEHAEFMRRFGAKE